MRPCGNLWPAAAPGFPPATRLAQAVGGVQAARRWPGADPSRCCPRRLLPRRAPPAGGPQAQRNLCVRRLQVRHRPPAADVWRRRDGGAAGGAARGRPAWRPTCCSRNARGHTCCSRNAREHTCFSRNASHRAGSPGMMCETQQRDWSNMVEYVAAAGCVAPQDPAYPVYVDSSVIMGMTGGWGRSPGGAGAPLPACSARALALLLWQGGGGGSPASGRRAPRAQPSTRAAQVLREGGASRPPRRRRSQRHRL